MKRFSSGDRVRVSNSPLQKGLAGLTGTIKKPNINEFSSYGPYSRVTLDDPKHHRMGQDYRGIWDRDLELIDDAKSFIPEDWS